MPSFLVKVARDRDAYLEWSTIVDAPISRGTRDAYLANGHAEARLTRADEAGTSARYFDWLPATEQEGGWDDDCLLVGDHEEPPGHGGRIMRDRLSDLYDHLAAGGRGIPSALVVPWDDEAEEP